MLETIDLLPIGSLNSEPWIFFVSIGLIIYYRLQSQRSQILFILLLSILFAFSANQYSLMPIITLLIATSFNYFFYRHSFDSKLIASVGIIFNILFLIFAKYLLFGLSFVGLADAFRDVTNLLLFAGISYYSFSMIATITDGYKTKPINPQITNFFIYALFFPRIIMGPIMSFNDFASQISKKSIDEANFKLGLFLFIFGFAKKTMADFLFLYPNLVFSTPDGYAGSVHLITFYAYGAQLYLDFSGYTDMAIGLALLFGYHLPINFNRPYLSSSITEFWQKWHITLSLWLKKHIYIPMGGSKNGLIVLYSSLFTTFIISGIWHGVGLSYLLWGIWHGIAIALHKSWKLFNQSMHPILGWFLTFNFVIFGWIFFIYNDFAQINIVLEQLFYNFDLAIAPSVFIANIEWSICFFISWALILSPTNFISKMQQNLLKTHWILQLLLILIIFYANIYVKTVVVAPFIYESF